MAAHTFLKNHVPHNRGLRHEAKLRGDIHYVTNKPCKNGHIEKRLVSSGGCMECAKLQTAKHRTKETIQQRDLRLQQGVKRAAQWRIENPDHENTKIVKRRWAKTHPERKYQDTANRRAAKLQRTPVWLNKGHQFEIDSIYELCSAYRQVGFDYHVDHIVPLQGKSVSGLHVPWNLQIIHAKENLSKGNNHG
jgi:5-methylcytosine-specific restriction endonuclease McrA